MRRLYLRIHKPGFHSLNEACAFGPIRAAAGPAILARIKSVISVPNPLLPVHQKALLYFDPPQN